MARTKLPAGVWLLLCALPLGACAPQPNLLPTLTPVPATPALQPGGIHIQGAGATFPLPVYSVWTFAYQAVDPSVTVDYQGIGSGGGKQAIISGTVDFAGSDSLLKDAEYAAGKDLQMYPMLAGAVVPIYNLAGNPALVLDRATLVGVFSGAIKKWSDPALVKLNPGANLPNRPVTIVHRSDSSGTTELFTRALTAFSPDWKPGFGSAITWTVDALGSGVGAQGNQGVAAEVHARPDSIGYVELDYALASNLPFAQMVNKAGATVTANANSLRGAMADFTQGFTSQLTNIIVDGPGPTSWPIAGYTYLILHTTSMTDCVKAAKVVAFMRWALTDPGAAQRAAALGYSALPENIRQRVLVKLADVRCNGQPVQ